MRSGWMIALVAAAYAVAPQMASADDDVQEQLKLMQERLMLLEDKLENTNDQLEAAQDEVSQQKQVMSDAGLEVGDGTGSGIASFLQTLEIGGWVNIGYWHNFNDPTNGEGCGPTTKASLNANTGNGAAASGLTCGTGAGVFNPLNPDAQGFSFDQLWFELERPVSPEQRSGFRADITLGKVAGLLGAGTGRALGTSDSDIYVHQANIQYLADIPHVGDVKMTLGKFATLIGYEVAQAPYNHNISRGLVWAAFQPVDHLGFLLSGDIDRRFHFLGVEGALDWALGVTNGFAVDDPDINHGKTWTGRLGMTGENWSIAVAGIMGAENNGSESEKIGVVDVIMTWDPFTDLSLWMNMDRYWENPDGADPDGFGIAIGGHYTVNERIGATLRVEYAQFENPAANASLGIHPGIGSSAFGRDEEALSITGTLAYQLSDQIKVRGELRWDNYENFCRQGHTTGAGGAASSSSTGAARACTDSIFNERTAGSGRVAGGDSDQFVAGVDVIYEF